MDEHLEAVASRALIVARPAKSRELRDILSLYADNPSSHKGQNGGKRTRRQR
jgi:hypothetical protein